MPEGAFVALAPCWSCKRLFGFDPDKVPSVPICQECHRPPDLHDAGCTRMSENVKQPLCRSCIDRINENRRRQGQSPIHIIPGAYVDEE